MILKRFIGQSEFDKLQNGKIIEGRCLVVRRHEAIRDTNKYVFFIEEDQITQGFLDIIARSRTYEVTVNIPENRLIPYQNSYMGEILDEWLTKSYSEDDITDIRHVNYTLIERHNAVA